MRSGTHKFNSARSPTIFYITGPGLLETDQLPNRGVHRIEKVVLHSISEADIRSAKNLSASILAQYNLGTTGIIPGKRPFINHKSSKLLQLAN